MSFYAVANGRNIGIFETWSECSSSVKGYSHAKYKKFSTKEEAEQYIQGSQLQNADADTDIYDNNINTDTNADINDDKDADADTWTPDYYVYTDGSCSHNGRANATAGIGIFFGTNDVRNVSQRVDGKQTNNVAELSAVIQAYSIIEKDIVANKKVAIVSDSEYSLRCVSSYGEKCAKGGWKESIPNCDLVKTAYELYKDKTNVRFIHIKAHTNNTDIHSFGNANADRLANEAIGLNGCPYHEK